MFFRKKIIDNIKNGKDIDYSKLIDITRILTENDDEAVTSIELLVNHPEQFDYKYDEWLEEMDFSTIRHPDLITVYWLTGQNTLFDFGAYIDWKGETEDIIYWLSKSIQQKNYHLNLSEIMISDNDFTDEVLYKINKYLKEKHFTLINWNTDSDCYHLFIVNDKDISKLKKSGNSIGVRFHSFKKEIDDSGRKIIVEK
ncbi:DUF6630 family protein [Vagococcus bubulae]|uniref:DUF6630 domain-containing protein n=1 Tax=Vagococcus bubulae TaxID=1977868 RepID=A0A429ZG76_9ENTE|nr:hypothetical protein [Vagococcus bubulae]RST92722.1 hypothetical protein CBF36_08475 [Vagococcus bubulae]